MVNGAFDSCPGARDFGFQHGDARLQFFHRKRVQILPGQHHQRVAGIFGQDVIQVHMRIVDQRPESVNEASTHLFNRHPSESWGPSPDRFA